MSALEAWTCLSLVLFSAFLSASEVTIFSLSRFQVRFIRDRYKAAHKRIRTLLSDSSGLLLSLLVLTELSNIILSSLIEKAVYSSRWAENKSAVLPHTAVIWDLLLGILVTAPILLFFCDITPKVVALRFNQQFSGPASFLLLGLYRLMLPIRWLLRSMLQRFFPMFKEKSSDWAHSEDVYESDLLFLAEKGHQEGVVHPRELELIRRLFELDSQSVEAVLTPWSEVFALSAKAPVKEALAFMRQHQYSRVPIFGSSRSEIIGVLYLKDLIRLSLSSLSQGTYALDYMRPPLWVRSDLQLSALFRLFKRTKMHLALVKDKDQKLVGVISMNDVLDVLFEDLDSTGAQEL